LEGFRSFGLLLYLYYIILYIPTVLYKKKKKNSSRVINQSVFLQTVKELVLAQEERRIYCPKTS